MIVDRWPLRWHAVSKIIVFAEPAMLGVQLRSPAHLPRGVPATQLDQTDPSQPIVLSTVDRLDVDRLTAAFHRIRPPGVELTKETPMHDPFEVPAIIDRLVEVDSPPSEFVYVPTESLVRPGHDNEVIVELRPLTGGLTGLLVYSSLESLAECCGEGQPWAMVPTERLEYIQLTTGADVVVHDLPIPLELTRAGEVR